MSVANKMEPIIEKSFLSAIELLNMPRKDIVLVDVCDSNVALFGARGSKTRRDLQEYWNNTRRRPIRSYCRLLDAWSVKYSDTTANELRQNGRCPSPASAATGSETSLAEDNDFDATACLANTFSEKLNLSAPPVTTAPLRHPSPFLPTFQPKVMVSSHVSPSPSLPQMSSNNDNNAWPGGNVTGSPTPSVDFSSVSSSTADAWKGSQANPIVIHANLARCEQNFPFDIVFVPRIEHNGWARQGIDIRMAVGVGDAHCWEAWMDDSNPELQEHAIMVRGRSRSSDYDALDSYHRKDPDSDTASVHTTQMEAIQLDPSRQTIYWRIVTPKCMPLDNVILSGDAKQIVKKEKGVKRATGEKGNVEVLSYFVNWVVAQKNAGYQIESTKKTSLKDAFA